MITWWCRPPCRRPSRCPWWRESPWGRCPAWRGPGRCSGAAGTPHTGTDMRAAPHTCPPASWRCPAPSRSCPAPSAARQSSSPPAALTGKYEKNLKSEKKIKRNWEWKIISHLNETQFPSHTWWISARMFDFLEPRNLLFIFTFP